MGNKSFLFPLVFAVMILGMIFCFYLGLRVNKRWGQRSGWHPEGFGAIETSTVGLYALLLGFTFSYTLNVYDDRRKIIVQEANYIQTVFLFANLYGDSNRVYFHRDLHSYLEARIHYFEAGKNPGELRNAGDSTTSISLRLWKRATDLSRSPSYLVPSNQMLPALRDMTNIVNTRDSLMHAKLGGAIILVLLFMLLFSSFMMGIASKRSTHHFLRFTGFVFGSMVAIILITDLNRPYIGMVTLNRAESKIVSLREMFDR